MVCPLQWLRVQTEGSVRGCVGLAVGCRGQSELRRRSLLPGYLVVVLPEEVAVEYARDAQQQVCVYTLALENGVDVGAFAAQLACEPTDRAFLSGQFLLDFGADVYHDGMCSVSALPWHPRVVSVAVCVSSGNAKRGKDLDLRALSHHQAFTLPFQEIRQSRPSPRREIL